MKIQILRNLVALVGIVLMVGSIAYHSITFACWLLGAILFALAVAGMIVEREHND